MSNSPSLTEIEKSFQSLQFRLSLNISERLKTRFLGEFCILLATRENQVLNHSYYQELFPHMQEILSAESLEYQPCELMLGLYEALKYGQSVGEFETDTVKFGNCVQIITKQLVTTYINLSEFQNAIRIACGDQYSDFELTDVASVSSLDELCKKVETNHCDVFVLELLREILNKTSSGFNGYSGRTVWIPLVEKFEDPPGKEHIVGTIYPLNLELEPRQHDASVDLISFNNHPLDQDDLVHYQAQDAIKAARNEHTLLSRRATKRFTVTFGFPLMSYSYSGSSFGLGMSVLVLCNLEREVNLRNQCLISKSVAITGGIDLEGTARGINSLGLKEKIVAAFYSPLQSIVVPEMNLSEAMQILHDLNFKHPFKKFSILGENSLPGILDNRQILKFKKLPIHIWTKNQLTRYRVFQIILTMLLAVALTIGALRVFRDTNPSEFRVEGENVLLFNNTGKFLWEMEMGHAPGYLGGSNPSKPHFQRLQIHDYDGDGENEVIIGTSVKQHEFNGRLYYLETDGTLQWTFSEQPVLKFGDVEYTNNYGVAAIYPFKHQDTSSHEFYVIFSHMPWFPNRLARIDIEGNLLDEFISPGSVYDIEIEDLDMDGEPEILLGSTNNNFNDAAVAIMPSRGFKGTAPRWGDTRQLEGWEIDSNLVYIKFPTWGKYDFTGTGARTHVMDIFLNGEQRFNVNVNLGGSTKTGLYIYNFDYDLNCLGLSVSDGFLSQYHKKIGENFFDVYDRDEWFETMTQIDVWRNGEWTRVNVTK